MLDLNSILQISAGVDDHLRKLEGMVGLLREVKASLDELRLAQERHYLYELQQVKRELADVTDQLKKRGLPESSKYERELQETRRLLDAVDWPQAVEPACICDTPEKQGERAENILDLLVGEHMKGKRFLDYGCGEGHTIMKAKEREAALALGYDVDPSKTQLQSPWFTHNFEEVKSQAPYDIILLHDVLDHVVMIDPIQVLQQVKSVLSPKGRVYVRNHPWSSRHGGHLYLQKNKAFLHLVFDEIELTRIAGVSAEHNIRVVTPMDTYRFWFKEAGLNVKSEIPIKNKVEDYFLLPSPINDRLKKHWKDPDTMVNHLEVSFVEYVLEPAVLNQQIF